MIFLTGGYGYIGRHIARVHECILFNRGEDITSRLWASRPDLIIHCAGEIYDDDEMFESNVVLTYDIVRYCARTNTRLIYIGSSSEYGKKDEAMNELDSCDPWSPYAATKGCGTLLCQGYSRKYKFNCSIVRPFSVYGGEQGRKLIPTIIRSIQTKKKVDLIQGWHDYIHINDFMELFNRLVMDSRVRHGDIFNFGYGKQYSNLDVLSCLIDLFGPVDWDIMNEMKECDSRLWLCDNEWTCKELGYHPKISLKEGLQCLTSNE